MSTLEAMDRTGDTKIEWDHDVPDEVDAARATFDRLKDKRYRAYREDADGRNREIIHRFAPDADRIIMAPQTVGG